MMNSSPQKQLDVLQNRYGLKTASYLSAGATGLSHDISERLRAARVQAVAQRKVVKLETAGEVHHSGGSAVLGWGSGKGFGWLAGLGSALPLVALIVGMLVINSVQSDNRAAEIAEVDAALLTDELPPAAFADPGFVQFLKSGR